MRDGLPEAKAIVDVAALGERLGALSIADPVQARRDAAVVLTQALTAGRAAIARALLAKPSRGLRVANAQAWLTDMLVQAAVGFVAERLHPLADTGGAERLSVVAVGGYGRAEMAPFSDVDIAFLTPGAQTPRAARVIEATLYTLWDMGLKVGHSSRTPDETIRAAKDDVTIRTALLESRFVWGDRALAEATAARFRSEVQADGARQFIADKLAERDARHVRMGDTRYVVEPNVKEGKGGLRDLHALFWIGKYAYNVTRARELVGAGLLTAEEYRLFHRADEFLWAVRCHLHTIAGRAEERLTFDVQRDVAARMRFKDGAGKSAVERFMQLYFLHAKAVGTLSGVFLAHLDEKFSSKGARWFGLPTFTRRPGRLNGFVLDRGRLAIPRDGFFAEDPVRLLELFALADAQELDIHPLAMRAAARDAKLADGVRRDARANALFLGVLTSRRDPEKVLRWMNEAGVFGRFVPDFGRVVAQMQFDMYHHYTTDEHTIRAVGLLSRIERGLLSDEHPLVTVLFRQIASRRVLYVAVLLHDIAKGRGGDHSVLGAEVAERLAPRFGLDAGETEAVAWLVRHHLLMSATAFKRDLSDFKTILDFTAVVQSPERLRLLLALTVVDIRAVGPGVWNGWKRQLLGDLYEAAEEVLRLGHKQRGRSDRVAAKQAALAAALDWPADAFARVAAQLPEPYWVAEPADVLERNARLIAGGGDAPLRIAAHAYPDRGATLVTVYAADHPGLFYRIAGAIHLAGGNIIDARIHTTRTGMALDNFLIQDPLGRPFDGARQLARLERGIEDALANRGRLADRLAARPLPRTRAEAFAIAPRVLSDNHASNRFTVIEVNARDRPALLSDVAHALFQAKATIRSAHVATYGERAVDTFYVTDLTGQKIVAPARLKALEKGLLAVAAGNKLTAVETV